MLDTLYTKLTQKIPYKPLILLPLLISGLLAGVVFIKGIPMSIDFQGGTWVEVTLTRELAAEGLDDLRARLEQEGLEGLKIYSGRDLETGNSKITIITTSLLEENQVKLWLEELLGENLRIKDIVLVDLTQVEIKKPEKVEERLRKIYGHEVVLKEGESLEIKGFDLERERIENNLKYYLNVTLEPERIDLKERNLILDQFDPLLGRDFWMQGMRAILIAFLIMVFIVFFAFRDFIPSIAVILAATCDAIIAVGGMALLGISLEPASLIALLMLIGYSVDSDIMLTTRVLRRGVGEVNERIDDAMKTGLTMTLTTLAVMLVILLASGMLINLGLTQMAALSSIASVLLLGLLGDLATTWFMNAGILKWYVEERGGKFSLFKRRKKW